MVALFTIQNLLFLVAAVCAYFCGCFNGAVIVSKYLLRDDVRNHGSGNAGLTNFYRVFGGPLTVVVVLSDVVKAILAMLFAVYMAGLISPDLVPVAKYWAGVFCLVGHMYPCTFQFRGGKVVDGDDVGHGGLLLRGDLKCIYYNLRAGCCQMEGYYAG